MKEFKNEMSSKQLIIAEVVYWILWLFFIALTSILFKLLFLGMLTPTVFGGIVCLLGISICAFISLCIIAFVLPRPKFGTHETNSFEVVKWFINFQFCKIWSIPVIRHLIFSSFILRPIFLRCHGCKIGFRVAPSAYLRIQDPYAVEIGSDVILGLDVVISAHFFARGKFTLLKVQIGNNCTIGAKTNISAGTVIGDNVTVDACCTFFPTAKVPSNTRIGHNSAISRNLIINEGESVPAYTQS